MAQTVQQPERSSEKLGMAVGAAIALIVLAVYGMAQSRGVWPSGHPWIGMMWAVIGYMTLRMAAKTRRAPRWMYWITLVMALIGGVIWMWATLAEMRAAPDAATVKEVAEQI